MRALARWIYAEIEKPRCICSAAFSFKSEAVLRPECLGWIDYAFQCEELRFPGFPRVSFSV